MFYLGRDPEHKDRSFMRVRDVDLVVFDAVPGPSPDRIHFLNHTQIQAGKTVLDLGTGTGVQAIFSARTPSMWLLPTSARRLERTPV